MRKVYICTVLATNTALCYYALRVTRTRSMTSSVVGSEYIYIHALLQYAICAVGISYAAERQGSSDQAEHHSSR
jgi:hypothetical protein